MVELSPALETPLIVGVMVDLSGSTSRDTRLAQNLQALSEFFANTIKDPNKAFVTAFAMSVVSPLCHYQ